MMPPFHDTRFWYHALIGHMSSCSQIRGAADSIALILRSYNSEKEPKNTNFFARLFAYPSAPRRAKIMPVIGCKKKIRN